MASALATRAQKLVDRHGRAIRYLRISVTDRCDLRCRYCMSEEMTFLPRASCSAWRRSR
jgi:cyclic pyranopterin phosphate synthase